MAGQSRALACDGFTYYLQPTLPATEAFPGYLQALALPSYWSKSAYLRSMDAARSHLAPKANAPDLHNDRWSGACPRRPENATFGPPP